MDLQEGKVPSRVCVYDDLYYIISYSAALELLIHQLISERGIAEL